MERQSLSIERLTVILVLASLLRMGFGISLKAQIVLDETSNGFAYEVVDGLAIFDDDIVLGTVDEIEARLRRKPNAWLPSRSQSRVSATERL